MQRVRRAHALALLLAVVSISAFWPVLRCGFTNYDDREFVPENPVVRDGLTWPGVKWAFTTTHTANWHPVTWLSHMLDAQLFGTEPMGHHLVNLLIHAVNVLLLFFLLRALTGYEWRSAFAAALFAVHPLHVESVAWIAERKDVLSTLFWLLTMCFYARYARSPSVGRYLPMLLFFVLGLMSKPMLVTLPFVLLLLDWWPLGRTRGHGDTGTRGTNSLACERSDAGEGGGEGQNRTSNHSTILPSTISHQTSAIPPKSVGALVMEKLPLFALAAASSVVTYLVQQKEGAVRTIDQFPLAERVANALTAYLAYMGRMVWPLRLSVFYPYPEKPLPVVYVVGATLILIVLTFLAVRVARSRPYVPFGWLWYLGTLVPVIGLVQVGGQATADRYTYVPLIGLFVVVAWGIPDLLAYRTSNIEHPTSGIEPRHPSPSVYALACLGALIIVACSILTYRQAGHWRDSFTLFEHALRVTPRNVLAHQNLAEALMSEGRYEEAIEHLRLQLDIDPNDPSAYYNMAIARTELGEFDAAERSYDRAIRLSPGMADAHSNLGLLLLKRGRTKEAIRHLKEALRIDPAHTAASANLAKALAESGRAGAATEMLRKAAANDPVTHYNLGVSLGQQGKLDEAIEEYRRALQLRPDYAEAHLNLGIALATQGSTDEAMVHFSEALRLAPDSPEVHNNIGIALASQGRLDEAFGHFQEAARLNPNSADAHYNLGNVYASRGETDQAISHLEKAVRIKPAYPQAHFNLAVALFYKERYPEAWGHVRLARKYGFDPPADFLQALSSRMPEPR